MEKYYTVGEAAKAVGTTAETLRHYDRIGLVKPGRKDEWTNYRYYTERDIVRLNTVRALQLMDLPLKEIKEVLEYDDLAKIVEFLECAESKADEKIAALEHSKAKIALAKADYERKLRSRRQSEGAFIRDCPERVILLSDTLSEPGIDNLWNYWSHFYEQVPPELRDEFGFEDLAGVYTAGGVSRLFAVCVRYTRVDGLRTLPGGKYLCASCSGGDRARVLDTLVREAREKYGAEPEFTVQLVVVSGILNWNYEVQVYTGG